MNIENRQQEMPQYYSDTGQFLGWDGKDANRAYISMPTGLNDDGTVDNGVFRIGHDNVDDWQAAYQQQMFDWALTQYQNQWNTPANQVRLLKEAGLNPNVFNGSSNSTAASSSPQQATNTSAPGTREMMEKQMLLDNLLSTGEFMTGTLDKAYAMKMQQQSLDNDYERLKLEGEQIDLERQRVNNETRKTDSGIMKDNADVNKTNEETRNLRKSFDLIEANIDETRSRSDLTKQQKFDLIENMSQRSKLTDAQLADYAKRLDVSDAEIREAESRIMNFVKDYDLKEVQINVGKAEYVLKRNQAEGIYIQNRLDAKYGDSDRELAQEKLVTEMVNTLFDNWVDAFAKTAASDDLIKQNKKLGKSVNTDSPMLTYPEQGSSVALPSTYNYNGISYPGRLNGNFGSRVFGR